MTFRTSREIAAAPSTVFAAFADSSRLKIWWGPAGFTNTFETCEFKLGGKWVYVMHGANGKNYPNESTFSEIEPAKRVVIQHVSQPRYLLTVSLEPTGSGGTLVRWEQVSRTHGSQAALSTSWCRRMSISIGCLQRCCRLSG